MMTNRTYQQGLHDLGNGSYAWLQPDGSWGWNNAGLITDGEESLLVDTLFDLKQTEKMLDVMQKVSPTGRSFKTLVNTHANGDHCWGNQLVHGAEIIASAKGAREMAEFRPENMAKLMQVAKVIVKMGMAGELLGRAFGVTGIQKLAAICEAAPFVLEIFGDFDFSGITLTVPTRTFDKQLELKVGDKRVELLEVGPAHTKGDIMAWVPADKTVFTGDILFIGGHPVVWEGPVSNWINACKKILAMDVEVIVPGHGPLTDKNGVKRVSDYLDYLYTETSKRYQAGMSAEQAARDISFSDFSHWSDAERVVVNVSTIYRELSGSAEPDDVIRLFAAMAKLWQEQKR
jgi:cyclase